MALSTASSTVRHVDMHRAGAAGTKVVRVLTSLLEGKIFAERTQAGAPSVLALHGWGRTRSDLLPVLAAHAALIPDLPGFGASPPPAVPWDSEAYAEFLAPLIEQNEPWTLVGHSFGGRVALRLAALRPDRVERLILTGVPLLRRHQQGRPPTAFKLAKTLHRWGLVPDVAVHRARNRYGSRDYRAATGVMRDTLVRVVNEDYADVLPCLAMPVDLVWGANDTAAPLEMAREAVGLLPAGTLIVSASSGHMLDDALVTLLRTRLVAEVPAADPRGSA